MKYLFFITVLLLTSCIPTETENDKSKNCLSKVSAIELFSFDNKSNKLSVYDNNLYIENQTGLIFETDRADTLLNFLGSDLYKVVYKDRYYNLLFYALPEPVTIEKIDLIKSFYTDSNNVNEYLNQSTYIIERVSGATRKFCN